MAIESTPNNRALNLVRTMNWLNGLADDLNGHAALVSQVQSWATKLKVKQRTHKSCQIEYERRKHELQTFPEQIAETIRDARHTAAGIDSVLTATGYEIRIFDLLTKIERHWVRYNYSYMTLDYFTRNRLEEHVYWLYQQAEELEGLVKDLGRVGVREVTAEDLSATDEDDDFEPGSWFTLNTKVPVARLRQAASPKRATKRVRTRFIDGVKCYSVSDARLWRSHDVPKT